MGRKTLYNKEIPDQVKKWCNEGLTEKQIAKKIGISVTSFEEWKNKYPELVLSLKEGKKKPDEEVENSLYKRAIGYDYEEITTVVKNTGVNQTTEIHKTKKQITPDVTAQIFWLKNRMPEKWRDKQTTELTGKDGKDLIPPKIEFVNFDNE
jgi:transcriptional regulator with XRE-family HTH domain